MSQLTYKEAQGLLDHTEIGYTLRSLDKQWVCFTFEDWDLYPDHKGERLYFTSDPKALAYDEMDDSPVFTTYREAESARKVFQARLDAHYETLNPKPGPPAKVWLINKGDDTRAEARWLDRRIGLLQGRFARSTPALVELAKRRMDRE